MRGIILLAVEEMYVSRTLIRGVQRWCSGAAFFAPVTREIASDESRPAEFLSLSPVGREVA